MKYISPSSLSMFYSNREKFYKRYIAYPREPREASSKPMLLGSAFDAYVKNALMACIYGKDVVQLGSEFHLETLFDAQVSDEKQWSWETGRKLFDAYVETGAFDELVADMEGAIKPPRFELEVNGILDAPAGPITIRGFIDCYYVNRDGVPVVLDWKCNNYCCKNKQSPKKYYVKRRPGGKHHAKIVPVDGMMPEELCFSTVDKKWADQLTIYAWMMQEPDATLQIEQLLCQPGLIECVTYRGKTHEEHKIDLLTRLQDMQYIVASGHYFDDLTRAESDEKCKQLQRVCDMYAAQPELKEIFEVYR